MCVPVTLRQGDEEPRWANWVHMIFAPLPTHLEDPAERVRFARKAVSTAKANFDSLPTHLLREASRFLPPIVFNASVPVMTRVPAGRKGDPRELAATAVWLASDAAGYVTGQMIPVDGGLTIA